MANNEQHNERLYNSIRNTLWIAIRLSNARQISLDFRRPHNDIRLCDLAVRERDLLTFVLSDLKRIQNEKLDITKPESEEFLGETHDIKLDLASVPKNSQHLLWINEFIKLCNDIIAVLREIQKQLDLSIPQIEE